MDENTGGNVFVVGVVTAILGLAVGFLGASIILRPAESTTIQAPVTDTKAANLRVAVNNTYKQHVNLLIEATRAKLNENDSEFTAIKIQLDSTSKLLADTFANTYGQESAGKMLQNWNKGADLVLSYTDAVKNNDSGKLDSVDDELMTYVESLATLLSETNSNLPKDAVAQLVAENITLIKASVNSFATDNFAESYAKQSEAVNQTSTIADALAGATVKQYPEKFE